MGVTAVTKHRICLAPRYPHSPKSGHFRRLLTAYIAVMCGCATYKLTWEEIVALYRLTLDQPAVNTRARYNVCPTTTIDTIVDTDGKRQLISMRWGLIPSWWSKPPKEMKLATFNARAETVATKPMFRSVFKRNRCLIPVSGYYEWQDTPGGKQPWYFTARDGTGQALLEQSETDPASGQFINRNYSGYLVPTNADIPELDVLFVNGFDEEASPLGAKGLGELSAVSVSPAITNAVYHATGTRMRDLPITIEKLL